MRSSVDFPPPEDPINASEEVSAEKLMSERTGASAAKDFVRCEISSFIPEPLFKQVAHKHDRQRQNQVKNTQKEIALHKV